MSCPGSLYCRLLQPLLRSQVLLEYKFLLLFFCKPPVQSGQTMVCCSVISEQGRQRQDCARQCKNTRRQRWNILRVRQYSGEACERHQTPCTQGQVFLNGVSSPPFCFSQLLHYFPFKSDYIFSSSFMTSILTNRRSGKNPAERKYIKVAHATRIIIFVFKITPG